MTQHGGQRNSFLDKLRAQYKMVILNEETYEEKASFNLTRLNVLVIISSVVVVLVFLITSLIILTPIKQYIPGYGDIQSKQELVNLRLKTDSLANVVAKRDSWINNIQNVFEGKIDTSVSKNTNEPFLYDTVKLDKIPPEDKALRQDIERSDEFSPASAKASTSKSEPAAGKLFFPPVKGYVTNQFNRQTNHIGVDIVAPADETVKAALEGHVIMASWTLETGHVIGIQHANNLISFYKHNAVLLKKVGNFVEAGEPIAIIGSSGELSTGPHLHFELWQNGVPVDPQNFIVFQD
jgi:murein DD-endopeptidase MepM/ murein hydrolase activator NlpD